MRIFFAITCLILSFSINGQMTADTGVNNLVHLEGYKTTVYGAIPQYLKAGKGKQALILIPGWGFDASVFSDFIKQYEAHYKIYAITIPGFGNTAAPPMPVTDTSYGEQYWNKGVIAGIKKLVEKEALQKPVIVGHFVQGAQLALGFAIAHPDAVSGVIVLGAPLKFIFIDKTGPKEYPLKQLIKYIDDYTAHKWFKTISKEEFDQGNYMAPIYSLDTITGRKLWKQAASNPLPVMIRYLLEFDASDISPELHKLQCPVLVLRSLFNEKVLNDPINNYVHPQFIASWERTRQNKFIQVVDVPAAASFVWIDNPLIVFASINNFLKNTIGIR